MFSAKRAHNIHSDLENEEAVVVEVDALALEQGSDSGESTLAVVNVVVALVVTVRSACHHHAGSGYLLEVVVALQVRANGYRHRGRYASAPIYHYLRAKMI